jgi:hypothetical protein
MALADLDDIEAEMATADAALRDDVRASVALLRAAITRQTTAAAAAAAAGAGASSTKAASQPFQDRSKPFLQRGIQAVQEHYPYVHEADGINAAGGSIAVDADSEATIAAAPGPLSEPRVEVDSAVVEPPAIDGDSVAATAAAASTTSPLAEAVSAHNVTKEDINAIEVALACDNNDNDNEGGDGLVTEATPLAGEVEKQVEEEEPMVVYPKAQLCIRYPMM